MENFQLIEFQQARDFSRKMNASFEFIKQNFKSLFKSLLLIAGPPVLLGSVFFSSYYSRILSLSTQAGNTYGSEMMQENYLSAGFWLEIIGMMVFMFLGTVVVIAVVNNYLLEYEEAKTNKIEVSRVWERVRRTLGMYMGTVFGFSLLLGVVYVAIIIPIVAMAMVSPLLIFFGVIAVFVLGAYVSVTLSLVFPIRMYEKKGFFASVSRSFFLIKGKWWSTFGLIIVMSIIQFTASSVFMIPWYINLFIQTLHTLEGGAIQQPSLMSQIITNVFLMLYMLTSMLLYSLPLVALAFQYFNLAELKEARGLMNRIETLGQTPAVNTTSNTEDY